MTSSMGAKSWRKSFPLSENMEAESDGTALPLVGFGQAVIGPPGSGKTTYVRAVHSLLTSMGRRASIINLDPAGEDEPGAAVTLQELLALPEVMAELHLGPNGALLYCMEYLQKNLDWLRDRLRSLRGTYLLFDCPGQVELYTHHPALPTILRRLQSWGLRLCAVHLVDSHYCTDPAKFISVLCTSLSTMLHIELPHINILSKVDLIENYGRLGSRKSEEGFGRCGPSQWFLLWGGQKITWKSYGCSDGSRFPFHIVSFSYKIHFMSRSRGLRWGPMRHPPMLTATCSHLKSSLFIRTACSRSTACAGKDL
ncbi:GPN-loop GTPase 2 isoform 3-T3 [Anomaloglossus baeobatrachus]